MNAYYNEIDPFAADWLENLIRAGHIAPGDVDRRSIADVSDDDIRGYTQAHFFAGIGGWSYALRLAGWPDDRPVWTGSCPCQPFSSAGQQKGTNDERHLWPAFRDLIAECGPATVFGEQVASKLGRGWLTTVRAEMEALGYAVGAADLCAAGVGAPHIRQRLWFVGERLDDTDGARSQGRTGMPSGSDQRALAASGMARGLADADKGERRRFADGEGRERDGKTTGRDQGDRVLTSCGEHGGLADASCAGRETWGGERIRDAGAVPRPSSTTHDGGADRPGTDHGGWDAPDWLYCRDGKWRPVEPGTQPLADGVPGRVGRLRAYGNAIVPQVAAAFVTAAMAAA